MNNDISTTNTTATTGRRRRMAGLGLAVGIGLSTIAVGSAAAEKPFEFTDSVTFEAPNPCTDELHEVTIDFDGRFIDHGDDTGVVKFKRSGTTSDGYTMQAGVEIRRRNGAGVELGNFNDIWSNGEGSKFQARGSYRIDYVNGELLADRLEVRCIKH